MTVLADYANKYETVSVQREDGILQVTFHSGDGSLLWGEASHRELGYRLRRHRRGPGQPGGHPHRHRRRLLR